MPEFQLFFTPDRMSEFWYYLKWILFIGAPGLLIVIAIDYVGDLGKMIRESLFPGTKEKDENDDDIDIYHY